MEFVLNTFFRFSESVLLCFGGVGGAGSDTKPKLSVFGMGLFLENSFWPMYCNILVNHFFSVIKWQ